MNTYSQLKSSLILVGATLCCITQIAGSPPGQAPFDVTQFHNIEYFNTLGTNVNTNNPVHRQLLQESPGYGEQMIQSFQGNIETVRILPGQKLYKIVPRGQKVSPYSPYWLTGKEFDRIRRNPFETIRNLALPGVSLAAIYDVYTIQPATANGEKVFVGSLAPAQVGQDESLNVVFKGGAQQAIIADRSKWSTPQQEDERVAAIPEVIFGTDIQGVSVGDQFNQRSILNMVVGGINKIIHSVATNHQTTLENYPSSPLTQTHIARLQILINESHNPNTAIHAAFKCIATWNGRIHASRKCIFDVAQNYQRMHKRNNGYPAIAQFRDLFYSPFYLFSEGALSQLKASSMPASQHFVTRYHQELAVFMNRNLAILTAFLYIHIIMEAINLDYLETSNPKAPPLQGPNFQSQGFTEPTNLPVFLTFGINLLREKIQKSGGLSALLRKAIPIWEKSTPRAPFFPSLADSFPPAIKQIAEVRESRSLTLVATWHKVVDGGDLGAAFEVPGIKEEMARLHHLRRKSSNAGTDPRVVLKDVISNMKSLLAQQLDPDVAQKLHGLRVKLLSFTKVMAYYLRYTRDIPYAYWKDNIRRIEKGLVLACVFSEQCSPDLTGDDDAAVSLRALANMIPPLVEQKPIYDALFTLWVQQNRYLTDMYFMSFRSRDFLKKVEYEQRHARGGHNRRRL